MTLWNKSKFRNRVAVILVDGSNLYATAKQLGFSVDFKRLLAEFDGTVLRSYYFTARAPADEQSTLQPMIDWLEFNGWTVPDVLLSGHEEKIHQWRYEQALQRTKARRPDLLK